MQLQRAEWNKHNNFVRLTHFNANSEGTLWQRLKYLDMVAEKSEISEELKAAINSVDPGGVILCR